MSSIVDSGLDNDAFQYSSFGARRMARAADGTLYIVYRKGSFIYLATKPPAGTWTSEQIPTVSAAWGPSIALDSAGDIHISFTRDTARKTYYIKKTAGVWGAVELVHYSGTYHYGSAIAIDSGDNVHVLMECGGYGIRYRKKTGAGWQAVEDVTPQSSVYDWPSVGIDSADNVHVFYRISGTGVGYRVRTTSWSDEEIVDTEGVQIFLYDPSIAIDSADYVHVVWARRLAATEDYTIRYRKRTAAWQPQEIVIDRPYPQLCPSIALDSGDNIHVLWHGTGWYPNTGQYSIQHKIKSAGWGGRRVVENLPEDQRYPTTLWAKHPGNDIPSVMEFLSTYFGDDVAGDIEYVRYADESVPILAPTATTEAATGVETSSATLNGTLDDDGGEPCDCGFEWGETIDYGNTTPTQSRTTGQSFSQVITGLSPDTTYHFRAFGTNLEGPGYGADRIFRTPTIVVSAAYALSRREL